MPNGAEPRGVPKRPAGAESADPGRPPEPEPDPDRLPNLDRLPNPDRPSDPEPPMSPTPEPPAAGLPPGGRRCPRGADRPRRIVVERDGPLLVEGPVEVVTEDGTVVSSERFAVALCACRRSRAHPWCDTSHRRRARPVDRGAERPGGAVPGPGGEQHSDDEEGSPP